MKQMLLVGLGGFVGAVARYKLGGFVLQHTLAWRFPLGTLVVNILGCLIIGLLSGLTTRQSAIGPDLRLVLFPGILGGFTTFSAFGFETFSLLRRGESLVALSYVLLSVICGVVAVWVGFRVMAGGNEIG